MEKEEIGKNSPPRPKKTRRVTIGHDPSEKARNGSITGTYHGKTSSGEESETDLSDQDDDKVTFL